MAFFNGHVEVDAGQFFAKCADMEVALDLTNAREFLL